MFWVILSTLEFTFIMSNLNEWLSTHSFYKREIKEAINNNLKIKNNKICTHLNIIYGTKTLIGFVLLLGGSFLINFLVSIIPMWGLSILILLYLIITLFISNSFATLFDNFYNHKLQFQDMLRSRK